MNKYNPKLIEKKWQKYWEENKTFEVIEDKKKEKFYSLIEFPYPSGEGLHVGHPRPFTAMDVIARKKRMEGKNVLFPIGFDAFGLPTENYAIKTGKPPAEVTKKNVANFTRQLKMLGYSFAWSRAVNTTDPQYYKWTQWIFLQLFKHGLAYKKNMPINWCLSCKIGLANEEVVDGKCERCGGQVEKRDKEQWMLSITKYADKLLAGLKEVNYIERAKVQQENWIGRKEGINIEYEVGGLKEKIICFTTRPDTNFGATFIVVAPESDFVKNNIDKFKNKDEVNKYIKQAKKKSDIDRIAEGREKTGIFTGLYAINNLNGRQMPIYVSDFVLATVGTGAVVGVPGHDLRDFEFAQAKGLDIVRVVVGKDGDKTPITKPEQVQEENGTMINSSFLDGLDIHEATQKIMDHIEAKGWGKRVINYKLRDWVFSRQRYWGEPIPLVYCENCAQSNKKQKVKNKKIILIHGIGGHAKENWFPWLKNEMEQLDYEVFTPNLPNPNKPALDKWLAELKKIPLNEKDEITIIGHSLGGPVACKLAEELNFKIKKLILVAPIGPSQQEDNFNNLRKAGLAEEGVDCVKSFGRTKLDYKKINSLVEQTVIYFSTNDPYIPLSVEKDYKKLNARVKIYENRGHFNRRSDYTEFRSLLNEFDVGSEMNCGWIPLPEDQLPLELPKVKKYQPTDTGESPLAAMEKWVNTKCPHCAGKAKRETDVMPNWAGSSWYFLRYMDVNNNKELASQEKLKYWGPIDWYNGGMEHTVLHLLYSRFWNQFLYDIGAVPFKEPYKKRTSHGMILGPDGEKMSKSRGNVINPDEMVEKFGSDAFRTYIMFMGPFDQAVAWDTNGLVGVRRFLDRVWSLQEKIGDDNKRIELLLHQTIKKVTEDIEKMHFNTAIAKMMELVNEMHKQESISNIQYSILLKILSPFAPHMCEELWSLMGNKKPLAYESWPEYNPELAKESEITLVVQINGKVRDNILVPADISESEAKEKVLASEKVIKWLEGKTPKKVIYVKGKLVSIVV